MQQTAIDRYLKKKYVQQTVIYCNTLPYAIPEGINLEETTEESGGRYLYRMTAANDKALNELTAHLEVANITYTARIMDQTGLNAKLFNDPEKSFTMQVVSLILLIGFIALVLSGKPVEIWRTLSAKEVPAEVK
ncbi:MAG: hypothetical protein P1U68_04850 [Verrucomicrobiales bacterium]|nr:hypothetical protein [Verrucomicrobiales bacterium]